ncbi:kinesin-domain-containing protein [Neoconidiobolus thromboides FSU 785]|nr:kinesin-domain-containing protein [Neoconidiobolus thromboides FSU 785]
MSNIFVCVRCRPLNTREKTRGAIGLIRMEGNQTIIDRPVSSKEEKNPIIKEENQPKTFAFDRSYWSASTPSDPNYASQKMVFNDIGKSMLDHAFNGYNTCIFAYGQTGSGKSYSMVGYGEDKGIIPLTCIELFDRINSNSDINLSFNVEVSYMEIYCERVRDLLNPKNKGNLRVREHPALGPYVEDLSKMVVKSYKDIEDLMDEGNKARTVASTNMNATSSRSHAVFTIILTQARFDPDAQMATEKVSRISLVDLAGSERANSTGASGQRLKEGANINKSLTTLGKVISALADQAAMPIKKGKKKEDFFIPYRDSVLTWLLKDSLGGNSKTIMLAAISPADYEETLSTLRYADRAKRIVNKAVVNEDPNAKVIRELKQELDLLRSRLAVYNPEEAYSSTGGGVAGGNVGAKAGLIMKPDGTTQTAAEIKDQLEVSEKLMKELNQTWEEKLIQTQSIQADREKALEELGITIEKNDVGVHSPKRTPHLVNLNEDPLMSECLIYSLKLGITKVGLMESEEERDVEIKLSGTSILPNHCYFENINSTVTIYPTKGSMTLVNGRQVTEPKRLRSGYRVILGDNHVFRFNNPEEVRRERTKTRLSVSVTNGDLGEYSEASSQSPMERPDSRASTITSDVIDWNYAWREVNGNTTESVLSDNSLENNLSYRHSRKPTNSSFEYRPPSSSTRSPETAELEMKLKQNQLEMERQLIEQRKQYEETFKKLVESKIEGNIIVPRIYTEKEKTLINKFLNNLKKRTFVTMAETILMNAITLKEANIIAKELKKNVSYQFIVINELSTINCHSFWEDKSQLEELDSNEDDMLLSNKTPFIAIQLIDRNNQMSYIWSIDKLKQKLIRMRNLYNLMDRPLYHQHFNLQDPFVESLVTKYSLIGLAYVNLANLMYNLKQTFNTPIINHLDGKVYGEFKVTINPLAIVNNNNNNNNNNNVLSVGDQLIFEIIMEELNNISEDLYTQVHVQFRLSSFNTIIPYSISDQLFATDPISNFNNKTMQIQYRHTITINITNEFINNIQLQPMKFEIYGKPSLITINKWDHINQQQNEIDPNQQINLIGAPNGFNPKIKERRPEDELILKETHDLLAKIQISELNPNGQYVNAEIQATNPTDNGVFLLRQGLQRRILISLQHNSGKQFQIDKIIKIVIGRIRLVDNKGRFTHDNLKSQSDIIELNLILNTIKEEISQDGLNKYEFQVNWDSSLHNSIHLNKNTIANQRVVLTLNWQLMSNKVQDPLTFTIDLPLIITSRTSSVSKSLFSFMTNSTRLLSNISQLYQLILTPKMIRKRTELWKLDTATSYVRGEEYLGNWKPRGVELILENRKIQFNIRKRVELQMLRQANELRRLQNGGMELVMPKIDNPVQLNMINNWWLGMINKKEEIEGMEEDIKEEPESKVENGEGGIIGSNKAEKVKKDNVSISSDKTANSMTSENKNLDILNSQKVPDQPVKMMGELKLIPKSTTITRKGYLLTPIDLTLWERRWIVIKRPFMYLYKDSYELEELLVFDLTSTRVDYNKDLEKLVGREGVFALYTKNNSYMFQAEGEGELMKWLKCIDQWYQGEE